MDDLPSLVLVLDVCKHIVYDSPPPGEKHAVVEVTRHQHHCAESCILVHVVRNVGKKLEREILRPETRARFVVVLLVLVVISIVEAAFAPAVGAVMPVSALNSISR
eukprot:TRINITY_DN8054_c0_g1_i1.p2 TRINITY_DN8054_c0_g1~~TRINITY_DN8054_c0_g1_i1.p2  ORF type:complete len:106 (-),score=14.96 TRINITY_DN8054_c0_g1_i1:123-440(-)